MSQIIFPISAISVYADENNSIIDESISDSNSDGDIELSDKQEDTLVSEDDDDSKVIDDRDNSKTNEGESPNGQEGVGSEEPENQGES